DHFEDAWMQIAALSARHPDYNGLLRTAVDLFGADPAISSLVQRLSSMLAGSGNIDDLRKLLKTTLSTKNGLWQAAALKGIAQRAHQLNLKEQDLEPERNLLLEAVFSDSAIPVAEEGLDLWNHMGLPSGQPTQDALDKSKELVNN